jgi:hypothetical protein
MEKILKIEDTLFRANERDGYEQEFEGYVITTDKQVIKIGVSTNQSCCENPGHFASADKLDDFIGAKFSSLTIADAELEPGLIEKRVEGGIYEGGIMHVNLDTDRGILQFTAYNEQNGYYGHTGIVVSEQLQHEVTL